MMKPTFLILMTLVAGNVVAQTLPSADVDTVRSGIGEESLAPTLVKKAVVAASVTVVVSATQAVAVSGTVGVSSTAGLTVDSPFVVKNVVVSLSGTAGFDRDAALEKGAKQAMPGVLVSMGMDAPTAAKSVKALGNAGNFVQSYKVVKETLIPSYILTADLTFNEAMLRKNFGGKLPTKATEAVSATWTEAAVADSAVDASATVVEATATPLKQWVVRVVDRDPAAVEKVRTSLNAQPATKAVYRLLTSAGAEMLVDTPMSAMDINRAAGHEVMVSELETALPTETVALPGASSGAVSGTWEGTEQKAVVDGAAPEGTY